MNKYCILHIPTGLYLRTHFFTCNLMPEPHFVDDEESADYFITEAVKLKVAISKYERIPIEKSDFLIVKR